MKTDMFGISKDIDKLVYISRLYGADIEMVQSGGGNTSVKNNGNIWIKLSGRKLRNIKDINDFIELDLNKIKETLSDDALLTLLDSSRDVVIEKSLFLSENSKTARRCSIEIFLHTLMEDKFVVHTHPVYTNAMTCSLDGRKIASFLFKESEFIWVPYRKPGYHLGLALLAAAVEHDKKFNCRPKIVFLQNHGLVVSGNDVDSIIMLTDKLRLSLREYFGEYKEVKSALKNNNVTEDLFSSLKKALRSMFPEKHYDLLASQCPDVNLLSSDSRLFTLTIKGALYPDYVVYCGKRPLMLGQEDEGSAIEEKVSEFIAKNGSFPKYAVIPGIGVCIIGANSAELNNIEEMLKAHVKILILLLRKGQPVFLEDKECEYLVGWEAEKYRQRETMVD